MGTRTVQWALNELKQLNVVVIASIIESDGSVPAKVGAKMAISSTGRIHGTVGGAGLELKIEEKLHRMLNGESGGIEKYVLSTLSEDVNTTNLNSLCGGRVTVAFERMEPVPHILLMGGGHVAKAISESCDLLGWAYSVFDERNNYVSSERFPNSVERISSSAADFLKGEDATSLTRFSDILLLGHDWSIDQALLIGILSYDGVLATRIGCIGSKTKWREFSKSSKIEGVERQKLDSVRCPIGMRIGAVTVEEIAFSVCSEIIQLIRE
ncbi:MAG: hypothetical protein CMB42_03940 [Euryarchaeota archaeon]|nr:hypothetical protein [Euryarchaeota archaeon]|tara:strand:+ start:5751 stop:6554 length:804 start_codon:yes stop_codon:yes gene_type:complete